MPARAIRNGNAVAVAEVPVVAVDEFRRQILESDARLAALFGVPQGDAVRLYAALALDAQGTLLLLATEVKGSYPALAREFPQAQGFEREIAEEFGVQPEGHPWLKPVRKLDGAFFRMEGDEVHEVAVGPVHAGVIEPGHFRFQCHGEEVHHLEISLGYQHRGVERAVVGGPTKRTIHYMETLAGDTSIGHATAYAQVVEALSGTRVSARAHAIRGIALELERLANHTGDLGALANDVGYLPTASYCGRLRGDFLNLSALLCGSRFGRGLVRPGGVGLDLDAARASQALDRLDRAFKDAKGAVTLLWETPSVLARFEETGTISPATCYDLGIVGPAARACGVDQDVRRDFPTGIWSFSQIPVSTWNTGDVFARAYVRWLEIQRSVTWLKEHLAALPGGAPQSTPAPLAPEKIAISMVEGWRGEIFHAAITDAQGRFARYKVIDPSFHNWIGLAMSLRGQQISDFPLCNKSFNLSYCGHDL